MWPVESGYKIWDTALQILFCVIFMITPEKLFRLCLDLRGFALAAGHPNQSVLTHEHQWPIDTGFADRLIIMHGLETSEYPSMMLDEACGCWVRW